MYAGSKGGVGPARGMVFGDDPKPIGVVRTTICEGISCQTQEMKYLERGKRVTYNVLALVPYILADDSDIESMLDSQHWRVVLALRSTGW